MAGLHRLRLPPRHRHTSPRNAREEDAVKVTDEGVPVGLDFRIPFIGMKLRLEAKVISKDTHTIDITLAPPGDRGTCQVRGGDVEDALVNAIATIRAVMARAA